MSEELTNRQRIIRVAAGAAVCGLSISFLLGEIVDERAKLLLASGSDAQILPREYSLLKPLSVAQIIYDAPAWKESVVAMNSLQLSLPPMVEDKVIIAQSAPVKGMIRPPYNIDNTGKEPIRTKPVVKVSDPLVMARTENTEKKSGRKAKQPSTKDVEAVLLSIHDAAANIGSVNAKKPTEPKPINNLRPQLVEFHPPVKPQSPTETIEPAKKIEGMWFVEGKIDGDGADGHFEIGLFSQIDPNGIPMGFPFVQQILSSGKNEFSLRVPAKVEKGFLFAEFISAKAGKRTWIAPSMNPVVKSREAKQFAELKFKREDVITTIAAAPEADNRLHGQVNTMFAPAGRPIPQSDVVVKIRGRKEATRTNATGAFSLDISSIKGKVYLEFLKAGYHPAIVAVDAGTETKIAAVELASRDAIDSIAHRLGVRQASGRGIFVGKVGSSDGSGLRGVSMQMSLKNDGPYYFTEEGIPTGEKKTTTADGRFIFFNVEPSVGFVEATVGGENVAPFTVSFVDGGELLYKSLVPTAARFRGRLFNPVNPGGTLQPIAGAKLRIDGSSDWASTDSFGAFTIGPMKFFQGEDVSLEMSGDRFYNHRYTIKWDKISRAESASIYAFPAAYLNKLAASMDLPLDPYSGLVIGKVAGQSLRMDALADQSVINSAKDFYFDKTGKIRGSHNMTDPRFGTFIIFNVPKGKNLIQGNDGNGKLRFSDAIISSPSSVSVMMDD